MTVTLSRRPARLGTAPAPAVRATLDRLPAAPVRGGQRKPAHPTFNSAV